jgi:glucose-1-phosphate cytidylyltransferase
MKVIILAGGLGSRLSEETVLRPKPMVEIGGRPILWHIMKIYSYHGYNDFIILCGYKGYMIKEFFANYYRHRSDLTIDLSSNTTIYHKNHCEPWKVTLVDTGLNAMTGARIRKVQSYIKNEPFMLTYGDGVSDIDIDELVQFHKSHGKILTITSVQPEGRYGSLVMEKDQVTAFQEKPKGDGAWINAGFFVCQPELFDYIPDGDQVILEREPLERLAQSGEIHTYRHEGFWKPMDTQRDKFQLEELIEKNKAPWMKWGKIFTDYSVSGKN